MKRHSTWLSVSLFALLFTASQFALAGDFTVSGDYSGRAELKANPDFNKSTSDTNRFFTNRIRTGMNFTPHSNVRVFFQPQFVKNFGQGAGTSATLVDGGAFSVHQGFVDWGFADWGNLHVGRTEMVYGDAFVIGNEAWNMNGRAFDGIRLRFTPTEMGWIDVMAMKVNKNAANLAGGDHDLYGIYSGWDFGTYFNNFDLFFLLDRNRFKTGTANVHQDVMDFGLRIASTIDNFDYKLNFVFQSQGFGAGVDSVTSVAGDIGFGFTLMPSHKLRVGAELDIAGHSYAPLYSDIHNNFGLADQITSRANLMAVNISLDVEPSADWMVMFDFHWFNRMDAAKNTNTVGGGVVPVTEASKALGIELDLETKYMVNDALWLSAGTGIFLPGTAVKNNVGDSSTIFGYFGLGTKI